MSEIKNIENIKKLLIDEKINTEDKDLIFFQKENISILSTAFKSSS